MLLLFLKACVSERAVTPPKAAREDSSCLGASSLYTESSDQPTLLSLGDWVASGSDSTLIHDCFFGLILCQWCCFQGPIQCFMEIFSAKKMIQNLNFYSILSFVWALLRSLSLRLHYLEDASEEDATRIFMWLSGQKPMTRPQICHLFFSLKERTRPTALFEHEALRCAIDASSVG